MTAITPAGETMPLLISRAMRVVSTRVLPEPAPARISAGRAGSVTAASCSAFQAAQAGRRLHHLGRWWRGRVVFFEERDVASSCGAVELIEGILGSGHGLAFLVSRLTPCRRSRPARRRRHGAYTWGVLDALLEAGRFRFDAISGGTSAGAMNALALADGWMRGGAEARARRSPFWRASRTRSCPSNNGWWARPKTPASPGAARADALDAPVLAFTSSTRWA